MFWGFTEALDLFEEYAKARRIENASFEQDEEIDENLHQTPDTLNVLLMGAGDPRHIIKTMAKAYTHTNTHGKGPRQHMHFYMLEGAIEMVARNILLLSIALEEPTSFNLPSKVHLFMDVYGNLQMRPTSHNFIVGKTQSLINIVTDEDELKKLSPQLNLSRLRYRERDGLANAFNFWLPKDQHVFDGSKYWTQRVRDHLGARFDHREGVFDWDLNMALKERQGQQICSQEYRYWRDTGIAFTYPQYEQSKPNKTFAVDLIRNGGRYRHRGYIGDIETGPFCAFGLKTTDGRMTGSNHGTNDYRATDITERNLLELFHELQTQTPYEHDIHASRKYGACGMMMGKVLNYSENDARETRVYKKPWITIEGFKVYAISTEEVLVMQERNGRWDNYFDIAFVGHAFFSILKDDFVRTLRDNALLIVETKLMKLIRKADVSEYEKKIKNYARKTQLTSVLNYDALNSPLSMMKFKKLIPINESKDSKTHLK